MPLKNPRHPYDDTRSLLSPLRPGDDDAAFDARPSAFDPQILVLDHAGKDVWGVVDVQIVEEWRDGKALIPSDWVARRDASATLPAP